MQLSPHSCTCSKSLYHAGLEFIPTEVDGEGVNVLITGICVKEDGYFLLNKRWRETGAALSKGNQKESDILDPWGLIVTTGPSSKQASAHVAMEADQ